MNHPTPPQPANPAIPQVLLFGRSGAGKSALLGALLQSAETQGEILQGEVIESSGRLAWLRDALYRGIQLEATHTELISYCIRVRPWRDARGPLGEAFSIVLNDCSGKSAERLLRHPESLNDQEMRAPIARAVVEADAIVLLLDASSEEGELNAAFREFDSFLTLVSRGKAAAREVGGFPVFLVLTQCDKLVEAGDTRARWVSRMNDRAERGWSKFHSFLKDAAHEDDFPSPFLPFGSVELAVRAVSVRMPRLADAPGQPTVPFGVAELFRDCFAAAEAHRERSLGSNGRLKWTLRAASSFVLALLLGSIGVALFQPPGADSRLAERVAAYRLQEPPAAVRLSDANLAKNDRTLASFHDDSAFFALPQDQREFVDGRLKEIEDYRRFRDKLAAAMAPGDTRTLEELDGVERQLRGPLTLPAEYAWEETPAGMLYEKWLADIREIRHAEAAFQDRYLDAIRVGLALMLKDSFGGNWRADVNGLLAAFAKPPAPLNEPLTGSPAVASPRGAFVLNRVPYEFERVYRARKEWESTSERLGHLRDLADALGLTAGPDRPEAALLLPEPGPGINSRSLPTVRTTALLHNFNFTPDDLPQWYLREFPEPGRSILAARIDQCFKMGCQHVRALISSTLGPDLLRKDTLESWRILAVSLTDSKSAFPEWGRFLQLYRRLSDPSASDPVLELAGFLETKAFDVNLKGFDLAIPADLSLEKVVPAGPLTLAIDRTSAPATNERFNQIGEGIREASLTTYRLQAEKESKVTYVPGQKIRMEIAVRAANKDMKLVWEQSGSKVYPFDLFAREPRLVKAGGVSEPAVGVKLSQAQGSIWPHIPVLFSELNR